MNKFKPNFKQSRIVSKKLRDYANGQECRRCKIKNDTTVLCHFRKFGLTGSNQKPHDIHAWFGCFTCHEDELEHGFSEMLQAILETQSILIDAKIIILDCDDILLTKLEKSSKRNSCSLMMDGCKHKNTSSNNSSIHTPYHLHGICGNNNRPHLIHGFHTCEFCDANYREDGDEEIMRAIFITQIRLINEGIIIVSGDKNQKLKR